MQKDSVGQDICPAIASKHLVWKSLDRLEARTKVAKRLRTCRSKRPSLMSLQWVLRSGRVKRHLRNVQGGILARTHPLLSPNLLIVCHASAPVYKNKMKVFVKVVGKVLKEEEKLDRVVCRLFVQCDCRWLASFLLL